MTASPDGSTLIVALGDSTTAGTPGYRSPIESPPNGEGDVRSQYAYWLEQWRPGWRVLNRGVNGERVAAIARRFERDVLTASPSVVVIVAGVNDIYQGDDAAAVIESLRALHDRARSTGLPLVVGSILPFDTSTASLRRSIRTVNDWLRRAVQTGRHMAFADTWAAVGHPEDPDRLDGSPDGLHPSAEGYRKMGRALLPAIESLLPPRVAP